MKKNELGKGNFNLTTLVDFPNYVNQYITFSLSLTNFSLLYLKVRNKPQN